MEPITLGEVSPFWSGALASDERADALIRLAQLRLISRIPSIPARVDSGELARDLVVGAIAEIVQRALTAPEDGAVSQSYGAGPYSTSRSYGSNRLWISDADLAYLLPPKRTGGQFGVIGVRLQGYQLPDRRRVAGAGGFTLMPGGFSAGNMPDTAEWAAVIRQAQAEFGDTL